MGVKSEKRDFQFYVYLKQITILQYNNALLSRNKEAASLI